MRLAIVEDNVMLADGLATALIDEGHAVDVLYSGTAARPFLLNETLDLIILDVNLPDCSGLDLIRSLRNSGATVPVLLLTARTEQHEKVAGLDAGADDYLTKPFDLDELKARVRALLRRGERRVLDTLSHGDISIDLAAASVMVAGQPVVVPRRERAVLELLLRRQGRVVSKQQMVDHLCGASSDMTESAVELYVHRLRKRLNKASMEIRTLRGVGYTLQSRTKP